MSDRIIAIIGAGGHAAVVADALIQTGLSVGCFVERNSDGAGSTLFDLPVIDERQLAERGDRAAWRLANGIGGVADTGLRRRVQERLEADGWSFVGVCHPSAVVSPQASVDPGAQIMAGAIVQPGARVGRGAIVNTRSVVEHDCDVGAWSHIAPGAILCGDVVVGERCMIGAGSVVVQGIRVGADTVVGAGAAVVRNFEGNGTLRGVPARVEGLK